MITSTTRPPCACGAPSADWRGDTARVYQCEACHKGATAQRGGPALQRYRAARAAVRAATDAAIAEPISSRAKLSAKHLQTFLRSTGRDGHPLRLRLAWADGRAFVEAMGPQGYKVDPATVAPVSTLAQWVDWLKARGVHAAPGDRVSWVNSAGGGAYVREGRVLRVLGSGVRVAFAYASGRKSERVIPWAEIHGSRPEFFSR